MNDWESVKKIFGEASELRGQARDAYLAQACAGQPELRAEVELLLRENDETEGPMSTSSIWEAADVFSTGEVINDRFEVLGLIGRGGIGEVYEVHDRLLDQRLALKTLKAGAPMHAGAKERFKREILMGQRVSHRNVCRVYDTIVTAAESGELVSFTMELLEGKTLSELLAGETPLDRAERLPLIIQMARGLEAIHQAGLIHRDFKPGNVVVTTKEDGRLRPVITDFGLTRPGPRTTVEKIWHSSTGQILGTVDYMAPEQQAGAELTPAADVFALGLVMIETLQGAAPHATRTSADEPVGKRLSALIMSCTRKEPAERPRDAGVVADELAAIEREHRNRPRGPTARRPRR